MPEVLRRISDYTPLGAAVQSLQDALAGAWPRPLHLAAMAAFALAASLAAARSFRWEWGAGMLVLATLLTMRWFFFVAYAITGFLQAFWILPTALAFVGVAATSVVIYTAPAGFPPPSFEAWFGYLFIICLQTLLTGFFSLMA